MKIGFTGTRKGMVLEQKLALEILLSHFPKGEKEMFNHGGAEGADTEAEKVAMRNGWRAVEFMPQGRKAEDKLERNHQIVDASQLLIAAPSGTDEVLRSGTWATVRYARTEGVPVIFLDPGQR